MITVNTKYINNRDAVTAWGVYADGSNALKLITTEGEPLMKASVFVEGVNVNEHHVLIKDYSENEGITQCLADNGVVEVLRTMEIGEFKSKVDVCLILDRTK